MLMFSGCSASFVAASDSSTCTISKCRDSVTKLDCWGGNTWEKLGSEDNIGFGEELNDKPQEIHVGEGYEFPSVFFANVSQMSFSMPFGFQEMCL